ncbi:MAG: hypothetical protein H7Z37_07655 [Pyrinomonadaceae bacterium]|nr:hypothetical protein [Pyrinomonadaceae bacterium]
MKKVILSLIFAATLIFGANVLTTFAQGEVNFSGSIGNGKLQKGKSATATIVMEIPNGLHVNSRNPGSRYAIPTKITVTGTGLKAGTISYPNGTTKKFTFSEEQLSVYEGRATFRFNVTVPATFKGNVAKLRAVISYQSCSDEVCYRPRTGEVTLSASVR